MSDLSNPSLTRVATRWTSGTPLPLPENFGNAMPLLVDSVTGALLVTNLGGSSGGSSGSSGNTGVVSTYTVTTAFTIGSLTSALGDIITLTQIVSTTASPAEIASFWYNATKAAALTAAPSFANLALQGSQALTSGQLSAMTVNSKVTNDATSPIPVMDHNSAKNGATYINTTGAKTGSWYAIQVVADAAFTLLTGNWSGDAVASTDIFPAGTVLYGSFTAITLASGKVVAYTV